MNGSKVKIQSRFEQDILIFSLEGKIDSSNAPQVEQEFLKTEEQFSEKKVVLDVEKLEYISSAGLRVFLKLKKIQPEFSIINVSLEVYEVFEMTGFTDMMDIQKKLREFSVEGCKMIGEGCMGKIYRINPETIIKVYPPKINMEFVERERKSSQIALKQGLPTAIAFDVVRVGESYGGMYELLEAENLSATIQNQQDKAEEWIRKFAELAKQIHTTNLATGTLQPATDIFRTAAEKGFPKWLKQKESDQFMELLDVIPKRDTLVHGDLHPKNVLVRDGELELIDMGDLSQGHPIIELGCMYVSHMMMPEQGLDMPREFAQKVWEKFLFYYFGEMNEETRTVLNRVFQWIATSRLFTMSSYVMDPNNPDHRNRIESMKQNVFCDKNELKKDLEYLQERLFTDK